MSRSRVLLPQPEGPMSETNSPGSTVRSMPESATTCPAAASKTLSTAVTVTASVVITDSVMMRPPCVDSCGRERP